MTHESAPVYNLTITISRLNRVNYVAIIKKRGTQQAVETDNYCDTHQSSSET